jgi:uncharacterized protein (DUF2249 family)
LPLPGYRYTRATQMTTQYRWLYERNGPFGWKAEARQVKKTEKNQNAGF